MLQWCTSTNRNTTASQLLTFSASRPLCGRGDEEKAKSTTDGVEDKIDEFATYTGSVCASRVANTRAKLMAEYGLTCGPMPPRHVLHDRNGSTSAGVNPAITAPVDTIRRASNVAGHQA